MDLIIISMRTIIFYFIIIFSYRIMGKREISQLSIFDLTVSIIIAELAAMSISEYHRNIFLSLIPIAIVIILQIIIAIISLKNEDIRNTIDGKPSLIINQGKINFKEMVKNRYSLDDLLVQLRGSGIKSIGEVEYAILETNGRLSVFCYEKNDHTFPLPLILDGKVQEENLPLIDKDSNWLRKTLKANKYQISKIFYAFYRNKEVVVIRKD